MQDLPFEICLSKDEVIIPGFPPVGGFGPICLNSFDEDGCMSEVEFFYEDKKAICTTLGGATSIDHYYFKRGIEINYDRISVETVALLREQLWKCQFNNKTPLILEIKNGCCEYYRTDEPILVFMDLDNETLTSTSKNGCYVEDFTIRLTEYGTCEEILPLTEPFGVIGV